MSLNHTLTSRRCRIAIFLPSLRGGGAERVMVQLANGFARKGHSVDLLLAQAEGRYRDEVSGEVDIIDLSSKRVSSALRPLANYLRTKRPDALLTAMAHANLVAIVAHKMARSRARLVISERNSLARLSGASGVAFRCIMRALYPFADRVVCVSEGIADELKHEAAVPSRLLRAIPNPVDTADIAGKAQDRPNHPWFEGGAAPVIVAVGRLETQKDYPTLIAAFNEVRSRRSVRLIILGEGSLRERLQTDINRRGLTASVSLAGFQANPFGWMAAARLYVMSSLYEGFPNSLVQAMACNTQVVSTDCPTGPSQILEGGKWGTLAPVGCAPALARAIESALDRQDSPDVRRRAADYAIDGIVMQYLDELVG